MSLKYPKGETIWVSHFCKGELRYITTSKDSRDYYYLYELINGEFKKIGRARTPDELEKKIAYTK